MNGSSPMRLLIATLPALLLILATASCDRKPGGSPPAVATAPAEHRERSDEEATNVATETVTLQPTDGRVSVTATVHQDHHLLAQAMPRVPGRILRVLVHVGDKVKRGETLAILDSLDVGDARLTLRQARTQNDLAEKEYARIKQLVDEEVLAAKELIRATAERDKALAAVEAARERLRMLGLDPDRGWSEADSASSFPLIASLSGIVLEKTAIAGELATPEKPLFTVSDLSNIWVEGNLADRQIGQVRVGAPAEVTVDAYPGEIFRGKVTYLAGTLDPVTRTLLARVEIANRDLRLKPQMFARMSIVTGEQAPRLTVPVSAVVLVQGEPSVFIADGDTFTPRPVERGETIGDQVVITRGLNIGDRIAVGNVFDLKARLLKSQISDEH